MTQEFYWYTGFSSTESNRVGVGVRWMAEELGREEGEVVGQVGRIFCG
jgi:hypothetical protein